MNALVISNILLWLFLLGMIVVVLALTRQIGVLHERLGPMGALAIDDGPRAGDPAPVLALTSLGGGVIRIGEPSARSTLLFFMSPDCPVCKKLTPVVRALQKAEADALEVVFASDGDLDEQRAFYARSNIAPMPYVVSTELGLRFRIAKLPYAVLIDEAGRVSAKGLVNNREQLESLLTAKALGVATAQEFHRRELADALRVDP